MWRLCESCCSAVGEEVECRTVTVDGTTYEAVSAEPIVRAGLLAASELMQKPASGQCCSPGECATHTKKTCCPGSGDAAGEKTPCCPGSGE